MNGNLYMIEALWDDFLRCKLLLFKVLVPNDLNNDFIALTFESIEFVALTHELLIKLIKKKLVLLLKLTHP